MKIPATGTRSGRLGRYGPVIGPAQSEAESTVLMHDRSRLGNIIGRGLGGAGRGRLSNKAQQGGEGTDVTMSDVV